MNIEEILASAPVVPLVAPEDPETAIRTTQALVDGGLKIIEVVLRTPQAVACLGPIAEMVPEAIIGAGTVLSEKQARRVLDYGARFIVAPGLHEPVVHTAQAAGVPVYPGIATATEAQSAWNMDLRVLKFFPAGLSGGVPMLKALGAVFADVKFMPTGGVSASNLAEYLAVPSVLACGGSWLTPKAAIAEGNYDEITRLAAEAVGIAKNARNL